MAHSDHHPLPQALPAILKWGLAAEDKAGALTAVLLPKALQRLDEVFDNIFSFSVSHWLTQLIAAASGVSGESAVAAGLGGRTPPAPVQRAALV